MLDSDAPRLKLKDSKTQIYRYTKQNLHGDQQSFALNGQSDSLGLEYLGFRYDGRHFYLRNSTVSGIQRKITATAKAMASMHCKNNPNLNLNQLIASFNYNALMEKFGRVQDFDELGLKYTKWTFWTYVMRSTKILGTLGSPVLRQYASYKRFAKMKSKKFIEEKYVRGRT